MDEKTLEEKAAEAKVEGETTTEEEGRTVPESALIKQAKDFKDQINALTQQLEGITTAKQKAEAAKVLAEEAELAKTGNHEVLLATREASLKEKIAEVEILNRKILEGQAKDALRGLGMQETLRLDGAVVQLPAEATEDSLTTWAALMKEAHAGSFKDPVVTVKQPGAGDPQNIGGGGDDMAARLQDEDKAVRKEANEERLKRRLRGEKV